MITHSILVDLLLLEMKITWKRTKWIKNRITRGRLNQNRSSPSCTTGVPLTISPLSRILVPILVMITWNFAPIRRIICMFMLVLRESKKVTYYRLLDMHMFSLTIRGMNGSQYCEYHPICRNTNNRMDGEKSLESSTYVYILYRKITYTRASTMELGPRNGTILRNYLLVGLWFRAVYLVYLLM